MRATANKSETLLELASDGLVRSIDADAHDIPRSYLRRLTETGELDRVGRGLYRRTGAKVSASQSLAQVAKRLPNATMCLLSALQFHELTTELPHAVWIMIDRHARKPSYNQPQLEVVRASGVALTHGIETNNIDGATVKLTSPAKTVADCFRYRNRVGLDVAIAGLRTYVERSTQNRTKDRYSINTLIEAAQAARIYPFMRPYIEALT
jgi:predicted transcriptional regulator of viral defense system